jgi:hypothetical protein
MRATCNDWAIMRRAGRYNGQLVPSWTVDLTNLVVLERKYMRERVLSVLPFARG